MKTTIKEHTVSASHSHTIETNEIAVSVNPVTNKSYHELADQPVVQTDCLNQLHANLAQLQDLQARFGFVMREVRYLLKA